MRDTAELSEFQGRWGWTEGRDRGEEQPQAESWGDRAVGPGRVSGNGGGERGREGWGDIRKRERLWSLGVGGGPCCCVLQGPPIGLFRCPQEEPGGESPSILSRNLGGRHTLKLSWQRFRAWDPCTPQDGEGAGN